MVRDHGYDAVHLEGFEVAHVALGPDALFRTARRDPLVVAGSGRPPVVVFDDHNAEFMLQSSASMLDRRVPRRWVRAAYSAVQASRLRRRESLYAAAADLCVSVSPEDGAHLSSVVPGLFPLVVPNGIDVASFPLPVPSPVPTVFFSGKMDYRPNVDACEWFVEQVLPLVRGAVPGMRVVLAGRDPTLSVRALASDGVEVTGFLTEPAMRAGLGQAWVAVVPVRMGSGTRFKVLEAMAAGVPVVSTSFGAAGSGVVDGVHGRLADDAAGFAGAIIELLGDPVARRRLADRARDLARSRHDWSVIVPRLVDAYVSLLGRSLSRVSVIGTVRNEGATIGRLVEGLGAQVMAPTEVVIVDGGSSDATVARARSAGVALPVAVHEAPGLNIAAGRNLAVARTSGEVIAVVDAGTVVAPEWLDRLARALEANPAVDVASGFFVGAPESSWERALAATTLPSVEDIDPARFLPSSRSVAFRRAAFEMVQGYPEWLDYGEDLVFDLALRRKGATFRFVPRAVVRFRPRATVRAFFLQYYRYARGDGKAGLFAGRHAIRYGTYLGGVALGVAIWGGPDPLPPALLLAAGAIAYLRRPVARLVAQSDAAVVFAVAVPWVPVVRLVGDVAKMLGYPAGLWWRWSRREAPHDRREGGAK